MVIMLINQRNEDGQGKALMYSHYSQPMKTEDGDVQKPLEASSKRDQEGLSKEVTLIRVIGQNL